MSMAIAVCIGAWGGLLGAALLICLVQWDAKRRARQ